MKVNPFLHQAYVRWLIQDVAPTLNAADARKGSLGKWHRLDSWEKQLTKAIVATPVRIRIDVSNDFELFPWIEGLLSVDLKVLSDAPGVDTDRRILRLAFLPCLPCKLQTHLGSSTRNVNQLITLWHPVIFIPPKVLLMHTLDSHQTTLVVQRNAKDIISKRAIK